MRDLGEIRKDIDAIDQQITALFEQRMNLTRQVAEYKLASGKACPACNILYRKTKMPDPGSAARVGS